MIKEHKKCEKNRNEMCLLQVASSIPFEHKIMQQNLETQKTEKNFTII